MDEMEENERQEYLARGNELQPSPQSIRSVWIACTKESWESQGLLAPTVSNLDPREIDASEQIPSNSFWSLSTISSSQREGRSAYIKYVDDSWWSFVAEICMETVASGYER